MTVRYNDSKGIGEYGCFENLPGWMVVLVRHPMLTMLMLFISFDPAEVNCEKHFPIGFS